LKRCCQRILDVRTSAHRPVVQTGQSSVCCASGFIRNRKPSKQWSWHSIIGRSLWARYTDVDPSIWTKPPTYLFRYLRFQRA